MTIIATISAFCHCAACCGTAGQPTASGAWPREGVTVAAPRSIPLGTRVTIDGHPYVVQDRTSKRFDGRWDIFVTDHARAKRLGIRKVRIEIP
jgi:3D (Asp-Asp-Asp) domain-containing protein